MFRNPFKSSSGEGGSSKKKASAKEKGKRKATGQGSRPSGNPGGPNARDRKERLARLEKQDIRSTRFYHKPTCDKLGIDRKVLGMAGRLGWQHWIQAQMPSADGRSTIVPHTYRELTLEFLSSFHFYTFVPEGRDEWERDGEVSFTIFGTYYELLLSRLTELFMWPRQYHLSCPALYEKEDVEGWSEWFYDPQDWWQKITDGSTFFTQRSSKVSEIQHAALRYVARLACLSLFSRGELGQTSSDELLLLWTGTEAPATMPCSLRFNYAYFLAARFREIACGENRGPIHIGGMITWIAHQLGHTAQIHQLQPLEENPVLDEIALVQYQWLRRGTRTNANYRIWMVKGVSWCYLPDAFTSAEDLPPLGNHWRVPKGRIRRGHLTDSERRALEVAAQHEQQQQPQPQAPPPPPPQAPRHSIAGDHTTFSFQPMMDELQGMRAEFGQRFDYIDQRFASMDQRFDRMDSQLLGIRTDLDTVQRVTWRGHTSQVDSGAVQGFPNHPHFPPSFDPSQEPLQYPYYPSYQPYPPHYPPYGGYGPQ